jgi:hypothetical protein
MKKTHKILIFSIGFVIVYSFGTNIDTSRGIPFVSIKEQWTIGIYRGKTPFSFDSPLNLLNPIMTAEQVKDVNAKFVADPFLIKEEKKWYLFFEVFDYDTNQGDLAVATSTNKLFWKYQQIVLDEPFHLSYPYVFKWEGDHYLIPESYEAKSIRLYKAEKFPTHWVFIKTLVDERELVDNSIVFYQDKWWLFSCGINNDTLFLFYAEDLLGPWIEHPQSPIINQNNHIARPSGRVLIYEDRLYRYTMDLNPPTGIRQVLALEIIEMTPTSYSERLINENPILKAEGAGWRKHGMHHIDPVQIGPDNWIASVDGFGKYFVFGWDY